MLVSIIILSYNTRELLASCIDSVNSLTKDIDYEIIVVDNASHDDSVAYINKHYPSVRLIENESNDGFAKGVNLGARQAKGDYLFFLNSDAVVMKDTINTLVSIFDRDEKIGIVGGLLKNPDGSMQRSFSSFYGLKSVFLLLFGGDRIELIGHGDKKVRTVDWVSGGCMMVRKDVFEQVQGFDEQFFMYLEDMELCKRVWDSGMTVYFNPHAVVTHVGQGSSNRAFAIQHIYKGLVYYYGKHKSIFAQVMVQFMLRMKAYGVISIGMLMRNGQLVRTYRAALQTL